jgi:hypothetical protein
MALLTLPPTAPQRGDRATFASRVDAFITWLINFVSELLALVANLNSIAAGGAYSIPYVLDFTSTGTGDPGPGKLRFNNPTQSSSTGLFVNLIGADGVDWTSVLGTFDDSTSMVKGIIRLTKAGDPSKFLLFSIDAVTGTGSAPGWRSVSITNVGASSPSPFVNDDMVMLFFQRTGDKGDAGSLTSVLWVRDEKASGQTGGTAGAGTFVTRTLNTIKKNSISGASVASNQITLPAGTYRFTAFAPAFNVSQHQAYLYNVTDAVTQVVGTNAYVGASTVATQSVVGEAEFVLSASKVFEVRHWTNTGTASTGLGNAVNSGQGEVFTQVFIEKVS